MLIASNFCDKTRLLMTIARRMKGKQFDLHFLRTSGQYPCSSIFGLDSSEKLKQIVTTLVVCVRLKKLFEELYVMS